VTATAPGEDGGQQMTVRATSAAVLVRSESWSPGWHATLQTVAAGPGGGALGPPRSTPVLRSGVIQAVGLPGPGEYLVAFSYAATSAVVGIVVSVVAAAGLVLWAIVELAAVRRRRRQSRPLPPGPVSPR
jgi:hypothetical protein